MSTEKSTLRWMIELFAWITGTLVLLTAPVAWIAWSSKRPDPNLYVVRNAEWAGVEIEIQTDWHSTPWGWIRSFREEKLGWLPRTGLAPLHRTFGRLPTWKDRLTHISAIRVSQPEISPEHLVRLQRLLQVGGKFHLATVNLANSGIAATTLQPLGECPELQILNLENCRVTDAMLASLAPCRQLKSLDLKGTRVTGEGLKTLSLLPELAQLNLQNCPLLPGATRHLAGMASLQGLDLGGTAVDDQGCRDLAGLKKTTRLGLAGTQVGDAGAMELATLSSLVHLDLSGTAISDAGAMALARLPQLSHLNLARTRITGKALAALAAAPLLRWLDLHDCPGVFPEAIETLRQQRPDLMVLR